MLALLGLGFGSFVNALAWRLHEQPKAKSQKQKAKYSIVRGRSMCPECRHQLAWPDLVPVISWLMLKGRCRYCQKPISLQYPLVETITAVLFVVSYLWWPQGLEPLGAVLFVFWLVFLIGFMAMAVSDLKWMVLLNSLTYSFTGLAILQVVVHGIWASDLGIILGAIGGLVTIGGVFYLLFQVSKGRWIGGGDVKLGFMLGLLVGGVMNGLLTIFVASVLGSLAAVPLLLQGKAKRTTRLPFGPFFADSNRYNLSFW